MNILPLLTFYLLNSQAEFTNTKNSTHEAAQSLLFVIRNFFMKRGSSLILSLSCENKQTLHYFKDIIEILYRQNDNVKIKLVVNNYGANISRYEERISNVLLVDSFDSFLKMDPASKVKNYDTSEFYHIMLQSQDQYSSYDIQQIFAYCWKNHLINVNIQVQQPSGEIVIFSCFPFSEKYCGSVTPVEINRFFNGTMINQDLFPQKLRSMHNCPLRIATWNVVVFMNAERGKTGNDKVEGFEGQLLLELSKRMNFKIHLVEPSNEVPGEIVANKEKRIDMLRTNDVDLTIGCFQLKEFHSAVATASESYYQASNHAIFTKNPSITSSVSDLWLPFEGTALNCLSAAFLTTLCLLYVVRWLTKTCFGSRPTKSERNVCLNFLASTLGLSSSLASRRNFGQILITTWLFFALVLRTGYGAIIYHFLRNNLFQRPPSNMQDISKLGYVIAFSKSLFDFVKDTSFLRDSNLEYFFVEDRNRSSVYYYMLENPEEKIVTVLPLIFLSYFSVKEHKVGVLSFLQEPLFYHYFCMYLTKHSFLADRVNRLLQRMISAGLLDVWMKEAMGWSQFMLKVPPNRVTIGPKELENVHFLFLTMSGLSTLVFCFEIMSIKLKLLRPLFQRL